MLELLNPLASFKPLLPYLTITLFTWLTYSYCIKNSGFVSDDIQGLAEYDGKLQGYEYGMIWRWLRYHIVGGNFPSGQKNGSLDIPQGKTPSRHHILSILLFNLTAILAYQSLYPIVGKAISLMAVLILVVHPCSTQGVAWISGLAYPLSLLWISVQVLLLQYFYNHQTINNGIWVIPVFCLLQWLAIHAIFATTFFTCILLAYLGYWHFAILGFLISGAMCFDQIYKTVKLRKDEFKKQHMAESTVFNWGKPVVAMKTFYYYLKHSCFPIRMGLYHEWGFHYEKSMERRDSMFWVGLFCFVSLVITAIYTPYAAIRLGILWFIIFSTGFWNWITAQQFVTERYIMVAVLGLGLVIAQLTINYQWAYAFILACYLCRTWTHLPTYDNELRFYQSNHWNFQKSEVALGNLGVTYARIGMSDSARDNWLVAAQINPDYDVPHVNIFYQFRSAAMLMISAGDFENGMKKLSESVAYLERALNSKVCHFPEQWKKEHGEVLNMLRNPSIVLESELLRLLGLQENLRGLLRQATSQERANEVTLSLSNNSSQMRNLIHFFLAHKLPVTNQAVFNRYNSEESLSQLTRR